MSSENTFEAKKILLLCGSSQTVVNFRSGLINALKDKGCEVSVAALDNEFERDIKNFGVNFYNAGVSNRSINPFNIFKLQNRYRDIIAAVKPDIVFTFMLKPNIFGVRAAYKAGVKKIFSMVEGAGDVFINNSLKWKIIRYAVCRLYRSSFKRAKNVFFLNADDKKEFLSGNLAEEKQCVLIDGIGVDLEGFQYRPLINNTTFLMVARMLKTKGIFEYCEAAREVRKNHPDAVFNYIGAEGTVKLTDIQSYIDDNSINYLGTTKDVRPYYEDCSVYVLPSYREGMPMSVMEAEAVGRAVIATDTVGCRDAVNDGQNGWLVKVGSSADLAEKMNWCLEHPAEIVKMGENSRKLAEERFDRKKINDSIIDIMGL